MVLKILLTASIALGLGACASVADTTHTTRLTDVFIADFTSTDPAGCTTADVNLTHSEAKAFFDRAMPMSAKQVADHYPLAPCKVEGTLKRNGQQCDFEISAAMTGQIQCGGTTWHFACDDCDDLFAR